MAKITWLGEDTKTVAGPSFNIWNGIKFPKDKAVEVTDEHMIAKARGNQFYKVSDGKAPEPKAKEAQHVTEPEKPAAKAEKQDVAKGEKASGYSPVKKKVKKPKPAERHAHG